MGIIRDKKSVSIVDPLDASGQLLAVVDGKLVNTRLGSDLLGLG